MVSKESGANGILGHRAYARLFIGFILGALLVVPSLYFFGGQRRHYYRHHSYDIYEYENRPMHFSSGALHPYAFKVYMMLKTGHKVLRTRLPVHFDTQLTRWPYFGIYADVNTTVHGVETIDVFERLPASMQLHEPHLEDWRILQKSIDEHWGWDYDEFSSDQGWDSDRFKNIPMLAHAYETAPDDMEWFVFIDDDTFVFQYGLISLLQKYNHKKRIYIGSPALVSHGDGAITFAHGGSGVILSKGAMEAIFGKDRNDKAHISEIVHKYSEYAKGVCCGDAMVAIALEEEAQVRITTPWGGAPEMKEGFQGADVAGVRVEDEGWCVPLYSWHHSTSQEIEKLFWLEEEHATHSELYYSDIYRLFMLPYITEERQQWNSYARDWEFKPEFFENPESDKYQEFAQMVNNTDIETELGKPLRPHESKLMCKSACSVIPHCLEWTWSAGRCNLEVWRVVRGRAHNSFLKGVEKDDYTVSGWMLDRIRERRLKAQCDSLEYDEATKEWNDDDSTSEGWFVRQLERKQANAASA